MKKTIDLTGFEIFDVYGVGRKILKGKYNEFDLIELLNNEWVPFIECKRKCSRSDYCKYVKPNPRFPDQSLEILCGVVKNALKNFIHFTFPIFVYLPKDKIQKYLDGAYHYQNFVGMAEASIGNLINEYFIDSMDKYAPTIFGNIKYLTKSIDLMGNALKDIDEFKIKRSILFIEGEAEESFIKKLKESHLVWFLYLDIFNYGGSGNSSPKRAKMLFDNYINQGYNIYIQADLDGKNQHSINSFIQRDIIKSSNVFFFKYDFETSIPLALLYVALNKMDLIENISKKDFMSKLSKVKNQSVIKTLNNVFGIDISNKKIFLAKTVGEVINNTIDCWQNDNFMNTEIGKFLRFIQKI